jgi:hypothetical protein
MEEHAAFILTSIFYSENGDSMFLQNTYNHQSEYSDVSRLYPQDEHKWSLQVEKFIVK